MAVSFSYHPALVSGLESGARRHIYFHEDKLLLPAPDAQPWDAEEVDNPEGPVFLLGEVDGVSCSVGSLKQTPAGWTEVGLRDYLLGCADIEDFRVINAASQLLYWLRTQNFCSRCGERLSFNEKDRGLRCHGCGYISYPKVSPCVIVVVHRGDEILLARSHRSFSKLPTFSCLAGFIEAGESAEEAVVREVMEESGVLVSDIEYVTSQAWPFPHQLMLGYHARYVSGDLNIDTTELKEAAWFKVDQLPAVSPMKTIAGRLIDAYVAKFR
ncbi:NAD(+) diphosphatase [Hahella sp. HN01]|uniref:NAD(+) diphosphatase n=1 Tax=Hahella sp. HN01 TaxID=2847262 RepID=UPI001C1EF1C7|nr:NAD(+) diphosphatase [Hahella sp. HN01]